MKLHYEDEHLRFHIATGKDTPLSVNEGIPEDRIAVALTLNGSMHKETTGAFLSNIGEMATRSGFSGIIADFHKPGKPDPVMYALEKASEIFSDVYEGIIVMEDAQEKLYSLLHYLEEAGAKLDEKQTP